MRAAGGAGQLHSRDRTNNIRQGKFSLRQRETAKTNEKNACKGKVEVNSVCVCRVRVWRTQPTHVLASAEEKHYADLLLLLQSIEYRISGLGGSDM